MQAPSVCPSFARALRHARRLPGVAAIGLLSALMACDDNPSAPLTSKEVDFQLSAEVGGGAAGRSIAVRAFYLRNGSEEVELEVEPAALTVADAGTATGTVTVEVLPCLTDRNRESVAGNPDGCRVHFGLALRAANGTIVSEEEAVATVTLASSTMAVESVTLPSGDLVSSAASLDFAVTGSGQLPPERTVTISSNTALPPGTLFAPIQYLSGDGWLSATIPSGQTTLSIVPTTTALAPGRYEAIVRVTSAWMFTPVDVRVAYLIPEPPKTVTIAGAGNGSGLVLVTPSGASCTSTSGQLSGICAVPSPHGSTIELTPAPAVGSEFTGWSGACTGTGSCTLVMTEDRAVTAIFTIRQHALTVEAAGSGSGTITSSPTGISCIASSGAESGTCVAPFDHPTEVTLTPTPNSETSTFAGWSGACQGTGACVVTMTEARTATATFALLQRNLTVSMTGGGTGTVTSSPAGIACSMTSGQTTGTCTTTFTHGASVELTAAPGTDMTFLGWEGACTGTATCTVTMDQARSVTARISPPSPASYALTITMSGNGRGYVNVCGSYTGPEPVTCVREYAAGTVVELFAYTDYFYGSVTLGNPWCFGGGLKEATCRVVMDGPKSVPATFKVASMSVAVLGDGTGSGTITSEPGGINCTITAGQASGTCQADVIRTTGYSRVLLRATPAAGSLFSGFTGCTPESELSCSLQQWGGSASVTAAFNPAKSHALTVDIFGAGSGSVTSSPSGIACTRTPGQRSGWCVAGFDEAEVVTLTASADSESSVFTGWSGACQGTGACVVTMTESRNVAATFSLLQRTLSVSMDGGGTGTVKSSPVGISCTMTNGQTTGTCSMVLTHGSSAALTATPGAGMTFIGWSGPCAGTGSCVLPMTQDRSVTATFQPAPAPDLR